MIIIRTIAIASLVYACTGFGISQAQIQADSIAAAVSSTYADLTQFKWMHGTESCKQDKDPKLQVVQVNANSYVIRQNKCVTFEAPFIFVLVGQKRALVVDTGANESPDESPLYAAVLSILETQQQSTDPKQILVVHSHSHGDHVKGDSQFRGMRGVEVVGTSQEALAEQLGLSNWPNKLATIELGERQVTFIPIPGHQEQSIAIYDHQSGWLLTGDSFYPGLIMVKGWQAYKASIERLVSFANDHAVSLVLGTHIEMNGETHEIYSIGTTYQPKELPLALSLDDLKDLNRRLQQTPKPQKLEFEDFIVLPMSRFQKMLSNLLSSSAEQKQKIQAHPINNG